jgi:hypothetical protein
MKPKTWRTNKVSLRRLQEINEHLIPEGLCLFLNGLMCWNGKTWVNLDMKIGEAEWRKLQESYYRDDE